MPKIPTQQSESRYQIYNEDCFETFKRIPSGSVDLVLCDPPYGTTQCKWDAVIPLDLMWRYLKKIVKPNTAICLCCSQPFTSILVVSNLSQFKYEWIWDKVKATNMLNAKHQPLRRHETIAVFCKEKSLYFPQKILNPNGPEGRSKYAYTRANEGGETVGKNKGGTASDYEADKLLPTSIQVFSKPSKPEHPTQKPVELMEYLIKTYSKEGDTVLDFAFGSGTTGVACGNLGRRFIGCDNDTTHGYFEIAKKRISEAYAKNSK